MAEDVRVTNFPNAGSHEAVALEIWKSLRDVNDSDDEQLRLFVKCRKATYGNVP